MAYVTGSVNTIGDLRTAIFNALTANGYTLSGEVVHKGNSYMRIQVVDSTTSLQFTGGTGIDGSNLLTGACPGSARIKRMGTGHPLSYPLTYEAHINTSPDEVYIVINYGVDYYQYAAWGLSDVAGLGGTGMWFGASGLNNNTSAGSDSFICGISHSSGNPSNAFINGWGSGLNSGEGAPLFYAHGNTSGNGNNSFIHHGLDSETWSGSISAVNLASTCKYVSELYVPQPNAWNGETLLVPYPVYKPRASGGNKISKVADLKYIRMLRIDNYAPGDIITLGSDEWKVYPWFRKNSALRNGGNGQYTNGSDHSGTHGFALYYTGI